MRMPCGTPATASSLAHPDLQPIALAHPEKTNSAGCNHTTSLSCFHGKNLQTETTKRWATADLNPSLPAKAGQLSGPGAREGQGSCPSV